MWPLKDTGGVMDIQKERKAFEKALVDKCGFNPESSFSVDDKGEYKSDATHFGWAMWQAAKAQAVPEGFVLVPKNPTHKMMEASWASLDAGSADEWWDVYEEVMKAAQAQTVPEGFVLVPKEPSADLVNHGHQVFLGHFNEGGQTGGRSIYFAYKAMIEAQEKSHD